MKTFKKSVALLLSILMVFSVLGATAVTASANEATTVYFVNTKGWENVYAYVWGGTNGEFAGAWPGTLLEAVDAENGVYAFDIQDSTNVIFNANIDSMKTGDLVAADAVGKYHEPKTGGFYATVQEALDAAATVVKTYTIAGVEALCGSFWDPADTNNDMTSEGNGIYTKVYNNVPAGTYQFKVAENHGWDVSYGDNGGDVNFTVVESATVTITFDENTTKVSYAIEGDKPAEPIESVDGTAHFVNTYGWAEVAAHVWNANNAAENNNGWPGEVATVEDAQNGVYSFAFTDKTHIVFNNNVAEDTLKTVDLDATKAVDKYYEPKTNDFYATAQEALDAAASVVKTYTVAGSEELCGSFWNAEDANNDMTGDGNGIYTKVYNNVPAGTYQFKVVLNRNWDTSYGDPNGPEGNFEFTVNESATVTITFDENTTYVSYTIDGDKKPEGVEGTAYFVNTYGWAEVAAHTWVDGGDILNTWPGELATLVEGTENVYSFELAGATHIIFNNNVSENGNQTANLVAADAVNKYYEPKTAQFYDTAAEAIAAAENYVPVEPVENIVYFVNTLGWSEIAVYAWGGTNGEIAGKWPGTVITAIDAEKGVYAYDVQDSVNFIFNNNNNGSQTANLVAADAIGKYYEPKSNAYYDTPEAAIAGSNNVEVQYFAAGTAGLFSVGEWVNTISPETTLTKGEDGIYRLVLPNVAKGGYEFKIRDTFGVWHPDGVDDETPVIVENENGAEVVITFDPAEGFARATVIGEGTEPQPTDPKPTEPQPTEPQPTQPKPTEPKPTQPATKAPSLAVKSKNLNAGATFTVKVKDANGKKPTFTSNKTKVATVDKKTGKVTALSKGTAKITVKVGTKKLTCTINVKTNPKLAKSSVTVKKNKTVTVKITGKAASVNNKYKNTKIAKVTSNAKATKLKVKGLKKGNTTLTITVNKNVKLKLKVKVK